MQYYRTRVKHVIFNFGEKFGLKIHDFFGNKKKKLTIAFVLEVHFKIRIVITPLKKVIAILKFPFELFCYSLTTVGLEQGSFS